MSSKAIMAATVLTLAAILSLMSALGERTADNDSGDTTGVEVEQSARSIERSPGGAVTHVKAVTAQ